jgi:hypothetical protein
MQLRPRIQLGFGLGDRERGGERVYGVKMKRQWPRKAGDGEVRWRSSGEQSCVREDGKQRGKRLARILTPRWSSGGSLRQQRSGEAAAAMATETWRQWQR